MKHKILSALFFFAFLSVNNAQWSIDSNENNVVSNATGDQRDPRIVNDGSGVAIITWDDYRNGSDYDIYVQKINSNGVAQWTTNGAFISTAALGQRDPRIVNDGSGGAIITWYDNRNGIYADIYAQKINSNGVVQWTTDGVPISIAAEKQFSPELANDGSGGAIITWYDQRNGSDYDIYAQKINSNGVVQWTTDGVPISTAAGNQQVPRIVNDGSGGAIITWDDYRNGSDYDIYVQKINSAGVVQWTTDVSTAAEHQFIPRIVNDGSGGAIITWYDNRSGIYTDIYAQKINSNGVVQWTTDGVPISTAADGQRNPTIVNDGSGGAIITWWDKRNGSDYDIYAQRVDTHGYLGIADPLLSSVRDIGGDQGGMVSVNWSNSDYDIPSQEIITYYSIWRGIEVGNGAVLGKVIKPKEMSADFSGKAYRKVNSLNSTTYWEWVGNIPAHHLTNYSYTADTHSDSTSSGNYYHKFFVSAQTDDPFVFWDSKVDSGYSVDNLSPLRPQNIMAELLPGGNIEISWNKNSVDPDVNNYQVHRADNEGFTPNESTLRSSVEDTVFIDIDVPTNINSVFYRIVTVDIHGNMSLPSDEVSITLVNVEEENKELPLEYALNQNYPNPFNPTTSVSYSIPKDGYVNLSINDALGKEEAVLDNGFRTAGNYSQIFDASDLSSGIYFYRLKAGEYVETKKMLLIK